jgi:hypothetical protein
MNEFKLELGSLEGALRSAALAVVKFIIVPLVLFILIGSVLTSFSSITVRHLAQLLGDYKFYIIVFGAVLSVLAALKGFYPKGSYSRLTFDLAMIPFYILLIWSFDMGGKMASAFSAAGFPFNLDLVLWLLTLFIVFKSLYKLAEFIDFRRPFREGLARTYPGVKAPKPIPIEDPTAHRFWQDFRPRYGRFLAGMTEADKALLKFVIFPLIMIIILGAVIQSTQGMLESMTGRAGGNADGLFGLGSATLERLSMLLLLIGLPIAAISFFKGFYPKGSVSRLTFALIVVALICAWIFYAALGGHISVSMDILSSTIHFNLNFEPLLWLFILGAALWGIYWAVEAIIYRKDWKQNGFLPVDDAALRHQRQQRRAMEREIEADERRRAKQERGRQ